MTKYCENCPRECLSFFSVPMKYLDKKGNGKGLFWLSVGEGWVRVWRLPGIKIRPFYVLDTFFTTVLYYILRHLLPFQNLNFPGTSEIAPWVKSFTFKPDDLSLTLRPTW